MNSWFLNEKNGTLVRIQLQPKASKTEIVGIIKDLGRIKIRVASPPVDGAANEALVLFLSKKLGRSKSHFELVRGQTSRSKDVLCLGLSVDEIRKGLEL